jgi:hypothetical protein
MKTFKELVEKTEEHELGFPDSSILITRNFINHKELLNHGNKLHKAKKLNQRETAVVDEYTGGLYRNLNAHHRGNEELSPRHGNYDTIPDYLNKKTEHLDSAIAKHKTEHPIHVWRGIKHKIEANPGDTFHDKGFVSTSINPIVTDSFGGSANEFHGGTHVLHIKIPKGSKALYPNKYPDTNPNSGEHEVILPRNSKFRYEGSEEHKGTTNYGTKLKYIVHHLTHLPE